MSVVLEKRRAVRPADPCHRELRTLRHTVARTAAVFNLTTAAVRILACGLVKRP